MTDRSIGKKRFGDHTSYRYRDDNCQVPAASIPQPIEMMINLDLSQWVLEHEGPMGVHNIGNRLSNSPIPPHKDVQPDGGMHLPRLGTARYPSLLQRNALLQTVEAQVENGR